MAKITAPIPFSGIRANLVFVDGVSETNDTWLIRWFKEHGYKVEADAAEENLPVPEPEETEETEDGGDVNSLTVNELKAYAVEKGIDLGKAKTKADIIAAIQAVVHD